MRVTSVAVGKNKVPNWHVRCMVDSAVGTGDFRSCRRFCTCGDAHVRSHVSTGMGWMIIPTTQNHKWKRTTNIALTMQKSI